MIMPNYGFPLIQSGYRWNILQRVENEVGVKADHVFDQIEDNEFKTFVGFGIDLTSGQYSGLSGLMTTGNPGYPPNIPGTKWIIKDIWEQRSGFKNSIGNLNFNIYFSQSLPPTGIVDQIEIHFNQVLNNSQKNNVRNQFSALISEKV